MAHAMPRRARERDGTGSDTMRDMRVMLALLTLPVAAGAAPPPGGADAPVSPVPMPANLAATAPAPAPAAAAISGAQPIAISPMMRMTTQEIMMPAPRMAEKKRRRGASN